MSSLSLQASRIRQQLASDPHRPHYHFLPPANWMNDPNGLIHWRGQYHLFYQYNPAAPTWGNIHWGHAVSDDLVHWADLPIALAPTPGGPDKDGCWSGVAIDNGGVPTLLYTGVSPEVQCIATGSQDLVTWEKYSVNPVLASPPDHLDVVGFRDPCVWQDNGTWYMTLGTGIRGVGGAVLLYSSTDLRRWDYVSVLLSGDKNATGEMWECPSFFPLGDKYVLLISVLPRAGTYYFIGSFDGERFTPEHQGTLDFGVHFFAPQTFLDAAGRRIMIGWLWEGRSEEAQQSAGWAGVQSLPRQLTLYGSGRLGIEPVPELRTLRGEHSHQAGGALSPAADLDLRNVRGNCLEIIAEFEPGTAETVGLKVLCSPDGKEETWITYSPQTGQLAIDRSRSSISEDVHRNMNSGEMRLAEDETLKLHVFLDRSVIEIFANGRASLSSRVYPSRSDSVHTKLFARGGNANLRTLDAWVMQPIWK